MVKERKLDFAVVSRHSMNAVAREKFDDLLKTSKVGKAAISVGVGKINGKGFNFSSKFPFVSEDGIIINMKRCEELGIPERLTNVHTYSHFEDAGGVHATLLSFLEAVVPYGKLYSYSFQNDSQGTRKAWRERAIEWLLRPIKSVFGRVNYEIQKKYDKE